MKIGVLAQYLHTRPDVLELISGLSAQFDTDIFIRAGSVRPELKDAHLNYKEFEAKSTSLRSYFLDKYFKLFGHLPASRRNFFIAEKFRIKNSALAPLHRFLENALLFFARFTPKFISYDRYLRMIPASFQTDISGYDAFFCVTQIYDDSFYAYIQSTAKPVFNYVYSWDHPCKMKCFTRLPNNYYFTWSAAIKKDVIALQHIHPEQIFSTGATQFTFLAGLQRQTLAQKPAEPFIYFACATGSPEIIVQEVKRLEKMILALHAAFPALHFLIRPYPFAGNSGFYEPLRTLPGTAVEPVPGLHIQEIEKKYQTILQCAAVVHFGTTLGIEAALLSAPVILADMEKKGSALDKFIHQYQNDKYLQADKNTVARDSASLISLIGSALSDRAQFTLRNSTARSVAEVASMTTITSKMAEIIRGHGNVQA